MTVDSNTSSGRGNDPEQIDLIELLLQLWRGKMTIIVAVIIAILLAVGYLMIAKEKWTSTAIITQPDAAQVGHLYQRAQRLVWRECPQNL